MLITDPPNPNSSTASSSSTSVVDIGSDGPQKDRTETPNTPVAFLTHNESLHSVLEQFGEGNVLTEWTEEDCVGLLVQLLKNFCDCEGAKRIVRCFRETSIEEITECFDTCKDLNKRALKERVRMDNCTANGPLPQGSVPFSTWSSVLAQAKKSRGIPDDSSAAISDLLMELSAKCDDDYTDFNLPNYKFIYGHFASLVRGYTTRGIRSIDAAIILDIFDDMEKVIGSMPKLLTYFNQMFKDIQHFPSDEFKLGEELNDTNSGKLLTNLLELPDDFFDLSTMYNDNANN